MKHLRTPNKITIEMSPPEYLHLIFMVGCGAGMAHLRDQQHPGNFYDWIKLANDLNTGNPDFIKYEIPERKEMQ